MTLQTSSLIRRTLPYSTRVTPDRRRFKRVPLSLLGRFMRANKQEYPCRLLDISVGGAALLSPIIADQGERIIVYLDHLGGLEGHVVRGIEGGFAIEFSITSHKREKLAAQLTWLINRDVLEPSDERRHERIVPRNGASSLTMPDNHVHPCTVLDVSISGAQVKTEQRPPIGAEVVLGKLRGRVVRHTDTGIGLQFTDIQKPVALRRYFG